LKIFLLGAIVFTAIVACSPEVGSEKWCTNMEEKPGDEWTIKEANNYAKHCILTLEP
jgi:hypothetical protein